MANFPSSPVLCLITDLEVAGGGRPLLETVIQATTYGVNMVRLRGLTNSMGNLGVEIAEAAKSNGCYVVTDDLELAKRSNADAIHLAASRATLGVLPTFGKGVSVHSLKEIYQAVNHKATYVLASTAFATLSHPSRHNKDPKLLRLCSNTFPKLPVIGIGGIDRFNVQSVASAGATGVAVMRAIVGAAEPKFETEKLVEAIARCYGDRPKRYR